MNNTDLANLIFRTDYIQFRDKYKKFVLAMDSRKFAEMIIKYGGLLTRVKIILLMANNKINVPSYLHELCVIRNSKSDMCHVRDFFDYKKIYSNDDLAKFDIEEIYCEFIDYLGIEHNLYCDFPPKRDLVHYFDDLNAIDDKIKSLDEMDCILMKLSHVQY